jgi:predicted DNA-binding protein
MDWDKKTMTLSVRLDPETIEELKQLAKLDDRKVSPYVARLIKQHVEENRARLSQKPAKGRK